MFLSKSISSFHIFFFLHRFFDIFFAFLLLRKCVVIITTKNENVNNMLFTSKREFYLKKFRNSAPKNVFLRLKIKIEKQLKYKRPTRVENGKKTKWKLIIFLGKKKCFVFVGVVVQNVWHAILTIIQIRKIANLNGKTQMKMCFESCFVYIYGHLSLYKQKQTIYSHGYILSVGWSNIKFFFPCVFEFSYKHIY